MEKIVTSNVEILNVVTSKIEILYVETLYVVTLKMGTLRQLVVQKKNRRLGDINKIVYSNIKIKMKNRNIKNYTPISCLMFLNAMLILIFPN